MSNIVELYSIIKKPVISEMSMDYLKDNYYTFIVDPKANKHQIKEAIEKIFSVKVDHVRTVSLPGKKKRVRYKEGYTAARKKAYVKLEEGQEIKEYAEV